jgi:uncharacterized delta-60 repeat protein
MRGARARSIAAIAAIAVAGVVLGSASPAGAGGGELDRSFADDGRATAFPQGATGYGVAIDGKGRVVVAGYTLGAGTDLAVARFRSNGHLDPNFGGGDGRVTTDLGGTDYGFAVGLGSSGRIVVVGTRDRRSGTTMAVAAFRAKGGLDRSFSKDGVAFVTFGKEFQGANAVAVASDDRIVVGGSTSNGETSRWALARLRPNGTRDRSFGGDGRVTVDLSPADEQINDLALVAGGKIVAVGSAESGLSPRIAIARFLPKGRLDRRFGRHGVKTTDVGKGGDTAYGVAEAPDGTLVVVGHAANGGKADWAVLRYGPKGRLDDAFHGDGMRVLGFGQGYELAQGVAVQSNGRIVAVGRIRRGDEDQFGIVRLKPNGAYDKNFSKDGRAAVDFDDGSDTARAVALQANGRIVVAGEAFDRGSRRIAVLRLLAS